MVLVVLQNASFTVRRTMFNIEYLRRKVCMVLVTENITLLNPELR